MQSPRAKLFSWSLLRYLFNEVGLTFFAGTFIFLSILLSFQAIRLSEFMIFHQVALQEVLQLAWYMAMSFVPMAVPIAFLFAVLLGISRLNSDSEVIALQSTGVSLVQLGTPLVAFGGLVTLVCLQASLFSVPRANRSFELLYSKLGNEHVISAIRPGVFQGFYGLVLFTEHLIASRSELKKVFLYDERDPELPMAISAAGGMLRTSIDTGVVTLRLTDGAIYIDKRVPGGIQQRIDFDVYDINMNLAGAGDSYRDHSLPSLTYPQLMARIEQLKVDPPSQRLSQVELHRRISLSFSCIVFSILGFGIALLSQKGVRSTATLLCLLVAVIYWLSYIAANAFALQGLVPPWLGIWVPNFFFLAIAWLCLRRYRKT